jgi:DNA-binding IclR family transcriptional regulator
MKSLDTALRVLSAFVRDRDCWGVAELATELAIGKSQVSKILSDLRSAGFVAQDPRTKVYSVGIQSFALGAQYLNNSRLVKEASGVMRRLTDSTAQTTTLCTLHGVDVLHLAAVEGPHFLDVGWRVGTWVPFHATAVGKVLFAFAGEALFRRAVSERGMPRLSPKTVCDPERFAKQLARVRRLGWSATSEETMAGLAALAVPVFGESQAIVAALGFIYPRHAVDETQCRTFVALLHDGARTISARLGAQVYPFGAAAGR